MLDYWPDGFNGLSVCHGFYLKGYKNYRFTGLELDFSVDLLLVQLLLHGLHVINQ